MYKYFCPWEQQNVIIGNESLTQYIRLRGQGHINKPLPVSIFYHRMCSFAFPWHDFYEGQIICYLAQNYHLADKTGLVFICWNPLNNAVLVQTHLWSKNVVLFVKKLIILIIWDNVKVLTQRMKTVGLKPICGNNLVSGFKVIYFIEFSLWTHITRIDHNQSWLG